MREHIAKLSITLQLDGEDNIKEVVADLPEYCSATFQHAGTHLWKGVFVVSCPVAPELAAGDLVDDLSPHFPALIRLKMLYEASYELVIAVGNPASDVFELQAYSVAMLAALGAAITVCNNSAAAPLLADPAVLPTENPL